MIDDWKLVFQINFFAPIALARGCSASSPRRKGRW